MNKKTMSMLLVIVFLVTTCFTVFPQDVSAAGYVMVDDSVVTGTDNYFTYTGSYWYVGRNEPSAYNQTNSYTNGAGYTAELKFTGTQVTLLATTDSGQGTAKIKIDSGAETTVSFDSSTRTYQAKVYTSDELTSEQHTMTITVVSGWVVVDAAQIKTGAISTNANLSDITLSGGAQVSPSFSTNITNYSTIVEGSMDKITITPILEDPSSTVTVNDNPLSAGVAMVDLAVGTNTFTIKVTAEDTSVVKTYVLNIERLKPGGIIIDDTVTGTGENQFNYSGAYWYIGRSEPSAYHQTNSYTNGAGYTAVLKFTGKQVTLLATTDSGQGTAKIKIDNGTETIVSFDSSTRTYQAKVYTSDELTSGPHTMTMTVVSGWVVVDAAIVLPDQNLINADLSGITLSDGISMSPIFDPATTAYSALVYTSLKAITITPIAQNSNATITIDGLPLDSGSKTVNLIADKTKVQILVTSEDKNYYKTYEINFTRRTVFIDNKAIGTGLNQVEYIGDWREAYENGAFDGSHHWSHIQNDYFNVRFNGTQAKLYAITDSNEGTAEISIDGTVVASGVNFKSTSRQYQQLVYTTPELSSAPHIMKVRVEQSDPVTNYIDFDAIEVIGSVSSNANLAALSLGEGVTLSPAFSPNKTEYTALVRNNVSTANITPIAADFSSTIEVDGVTIENAGTKTITLNPGDNVVNIKVTAEDKTIKTYTLTITRLATVSTDANLSKVTIVGIPKISPDFDPSVINYNATVSNSINNITIIPIAVNEFSGVTVNGSALDNGAKAVSLNYGLNTITVKVKAEDNITEKVYTFNITRTEGDYRERTIIPQTQMSVTAVSEATGFEAAKVIDGNKNTMWKAGGALPQSVTLNLGGTYAISKMDYKPDPTSKNGRMKAFNVYVSMDGQQFTQVIDKGDFEYADFWCYDYDRKTDYTLNIYFETALAKYVKFEILSTEGNSSPVISELNVYKNKDNTIPQPPVKSEPKPTQPENINLSHGSQAIIEKGLQFHTWTAPGQKGRGYFDTKEFNGLNLSGVVFYDSPLFNSDFMKNNPDTQWGISRGPAGINDPGSAAAYPNGFLSDEQRKYIDNATSFCFGDETSYSTTLVNNLKEWFDMTHRLYPGVIVHSNQWCGEWTQDQLKNYISIAKPDLLTFDNYYWDQSGSIPDYNSAAAILGASNYQRELALTGIDGTGTKPIVFGQYLGAVKIGAQQQDYGKYESTESQKFLATNISWAVGMKWVDLFRTEYDYNYCFLFDKDGAPTRNYYEWAKVFRQSKNIGDHLVRLNNQSVVTKSGQHLQSGEVVDNQTATGWHMGAFEPNTEFHISNIAAENVGIQNNGLAGDVVIGYFKPLPGLDTSEFFTSKDPKYFMVVNGLASGNGLLPDQQNGTSADTKQNITLTFTNPIAPLKKVNRDTGMVETVTLTPAENNVYTLSLSLGGGEAELYYWEEGTEVTGDDKTALAAKIIMAQSLTPSEYTKGSWCELQSALDAAITVNDKKNATQKKVDTALANLQTAIDKLVKITIPTNDYKISSVGIGLDRVGGITAAVNISLIAGHQGHTGNEVIIFELMEGNETKSIVALEKDIVIQENFKAYFKVNNPAKTSYTVKVFVADKFNSNTDLLISLAKPITLK